MGGQTKNILERYQRSYIRIADYIFSVILFYSREMRLAIGSYNNT